MLGFDKDHYSLIELAERWKIPFKEIEYHTERDRLEVHTWLGDVVAIRHVMAKTADGEELPVQKGIISLNGYYIVAGDELRKMYRAPGIPEIRKFHSLDRREIYTLYPLQESYKTSLSALEVSRAERDRFEVNPKIRARIVPKNKTRASSTSVGGRPSVMNLVVRHFKDRATQGRLKETLSAESVYLEAWAHKKLGSDAPVAKTIANKIGPSFTSYKADGTHG